MVVWAFKRPTHDEALGGATVTIHPCQGLGRVCLCAVERKPGAAVVNESTILEVKALDCCTMTKFGTICAEAA